MDWSKVKHFTEAEFTCRCGCGKADMNPVFMGRLDALRAGCDFPFVVTSGYRCPKHNARVSSTGRAGPHTTGRAVDIALDRARAFRVMGMVHRLGFTGIGWQQKGGGRFVHLDDLENAPGCPRPTVWSY